MRDPLQAIAAAADALTEAAGILRDQFRPGRPWSEEDIRLLREFYPVLPCRLIAAALDRPNSAVYGMAGRLGLRKSQQFNASPLSGRTGFDDRGLDGRMRPGNTPWNKGRKGWQAGGRSAETRFRPGARPHNTARIGAITRERDGYFKRKVRNDSPPGLSRRNWIYLHVELWEQHHGPVPRGMNVVFRNGDKTDIRIENLELVSDAELMRRNTLHRYPEPIRNLIRTQATLTRKINRRSKEINGT